MKDCEKEIDRETSMTNLFAVSPWVHLTLDALHGTNPIAFSPSDRIPGFFFSFYQKLLTYTPCEWLHHLKSPFPWNSLEI